MDVQQELIINIQKLMQEVAELQPVEQDWLVSSYKEARGAISSGKLPKFCEVHFILVVRDDLTSAEKLSLCWRGLRGEVNDKWLQLISKKSTQRTVERCIRYVAEISQRSFIEY